jgi:CRP-like cAMP-binding protein
MDAGSNYLNRLADMMNFPAAIPREELRRLLRRKKTIRLAKGEYFLMAGDVPEYIGFVRSGLLRLFYIDMDGAEANKHFCMENTIASSYGAFLQREESKFYIQALEDTKLLAIDYQTYLDLLNSHMCWQIVARKLAELLFILKEKREWEFLLTNAQERYMQFLQDYPDLEQRLSQYHIASYLGITPESLSRIRASLRQK